MSRKLIPLSLGRYFLRWREAGALTRRFHQPSSSVSQYPFSKISCRFYNSTTPRMSPPKAVLLIGKITHARREWEAFSATLTLKEYGMGSRQEFLRNCEGGMYDDVVAVFRSNASTSVSCSERDGGGRFEMGWDES